MHPYDKTRRERLGDQGSEPFVIGRIRFKHVLAQGLHHGRYPRDMGELLWGECHTPVLHEPLVFEDG